MTDAPLPSSFDNDPDFYDERKLRKFFRRLKDEPLVPLGIGLTCWAFFNASQSIRSGNSIRTNRYFRYRLYAQGFTIVAMIGGSLYYKADRLKRKEYVQLKEQQKAQEKREKWIKELEAREAEDKEWRAKLGKVQALQKEEAEELRLIEEARLKRLAGNEHGKQAALEIQQEAEKQRQKIEKEKDKAKATLQPQKASESDSRDDKPKEYDSILGEREQAGLLGHKHISGFYENMVKPMWKDLTGSNKESKEASQGGQGKSE